MVSKKPINPHATRLRHTRVLVVPLAGATAFSLVVVAIHPDLGLNLLADALALWFGLFVVEVAVELARVEARRPAHRAMIDDLLRVRQPIGQILMLALWQAGHVGDLPTMRAASRSDGEVAHILERVRLIAGIR